MKTVFSHRTATSSDVQPFGELSNFQSLNFSMSSSGNYCCCTSLPLKMTNGCKSPPLHVGHPPIWATHLKITTLFQQTTTQPILAIQPSNLKSSLANHQPLQ